MKNSRTPRFASVTVAALLSFWALPTVAQVTVRVESGQAGKSTKYFGVNGGDLFSLTEVQDLGINSFRLFMGMERAETADDDGKYGYPTIDDLKATLAGNPDRITDYINFAGYDKGLYSYGQFLLQLNKVPGMEPLVVIRNSANWGKVWVPNQPLNGPACKDSAGNRVYWAPFTQADWNEVWQYTLAMAYWINVRNGLQKPAGQQMRVDDWSAHNEPNQQPDQGWCGNADEYVEYIAVTRDALNFAYSTYLGNRPFRLHGGVLAQGSYDSWLRKILRADASRGYDPSQFDVLDMHPYAGSWGSFDYTWLLNGIRGLQNEAGVAPAGKTRPLWMSEWGFLGANAWDSFKNVVQVMGGNAIRFSTPGNSYVLGHNLWRMFDSAEFGEGLVTKTDRRKRPGYYAYKMLTQSLQGERVVPVTTLSNNDSNVLSVTTRIDDSSYWVTVVNMSESAAKSFKVDMSALGWSAGTYEITQLSAARPGATALTPLASGALSAATVTVALPALSLSRVKVTRTTSVPVNQAPTIAWKTSPAATGVAPLSLAMEATASDPENKLSKVELLQDNAVVASKTAAPFSFTVSSLAAGTYSFKVRVTDASGATAETSVANTVVSAANVAPSIAWKTLPAATGVAPLSLAMEVTAADPESKLSKVELLQNNAVVASKSAAPFSFTVSSLAAGTYSFKVRATDASGATAETSVANTVVSEAVVIAPPPPRDVVAAPTLPGNGKGNWTNYQVKSIDVRRADTAVSVGKLNLAGVAGLDLSTMGDAGIRFVVEHYNVASVRAILVNDTTGVSVYSVAGNAAPEWKITFPNASYSAFTPAAGSFTLYLTPCAWSNGGTGGGFGDTLVIRFKILPSATETKPQPVVALPGNGKGNRSDLVIGAGELAVAADATKIGAFATGASFSLAKLGKGAQGISFVFAHNGVASEVYNLVDRNTGVIVTGYGTSRKSDWKQVVPSDAGGWVPKVGSYSLYLTPCAWGKGGLAGGYGDTVRYDFEITN